MEKSLNNALDRAIALSPPLPTSPLCYLQLPLLPLQEQMKLCFQQSLPSICVLLTVIATMHLKMQWLLQSLKKFLNSSVRTSPACCPASARLKASCSDPEAQAAVTKAAKAVTRIITTSFPPMFTAFLRNCCGKSRKVGIVVQHCCKAKVLRKET